MEKIVSGSPELAALVDEASQFAAQVAGPVLTKMAPTAPQVFSHHLVGVALSRTSLPLPVSRALGVDDATLCDALLAAVRQRWPQESPAPWTALLSRPPGEAVATFHHDDTRRRDLLAEDSLDIAPHVRALALLVTSKVLKPPLAVGLFGDWGSGKTYFMRALRQEVDRLTTQARRSGLRQADLPVYRNVAQIEFNAWHFVDADLWASLADYIFANLRIREDEQEHAVSRRRQMYVAKLSEQGAAIRQVETERQHLQARIRLSETELEEVRAQARSQLGLKEYTRAVVTASPPLRDEVKQLTSRLGVPQAGESVADLEDALGQARATATSARSSVGVLAGRFGTGWSLLAVAALLFGPLVLWLTAYLDIDAFQRTAATAAGLIGGLAAWIRTASTAAGATLKQIDDLDQALADEVERHPTVVDHREALEALREEEKRLIAEESRLRKELISVEQALRELSPAKLLADFILSRNDSDDYRKHLGLASLIRRDFEALAGHIDEYNASLEDEDPDSDDSGLTDESDQPEAEGEQGNGAPSEAEYHVNRIVLYIDDLDRCPPETVAKVLQAVHLLLAFPLFVVIVGVDARWLSRSLTQHYEGLLQSEARESSDSSATPQDYLEKIFQIPFWLRPMPLDATTRLLDALTAIQPSESVAAEGDRARDRTAGSRAVGIGAESDQPSTVQAEQTSAPDPGVAQPSAPTAAADAGAAPRGSAAPTPAPAYDLRLSATEITQAERNFMEELRPMLGRSPRSLTRYVNILRLLKAMDRHSRATAPTHTDTSALDDVTMFLLAVLTGYPRIAEPLLAEIAQSRVEGMGSSVAALVEGARTRVDGMRSDSGAWSDNADEWDDLTNWIAQHSDWADSQDVGSWGPTAQRVARYSYRFDALAPARTT